MTFGRLTGDRGYDTDEIRDWLEEHQAEAVIPFRRNRKLPVPHHPQAYGSCHRTGNLFCRIKDYGRITLHKDKTGRSHAAFLSLAFALVNMQLAKRITDLLPWNWEAIRCRQAASGGITAEDRRS